MTHNESGSKQDISDMLPGISCLVISRLTDLLQIDLKHAMPVPAGNFDWHNAWFTPDFGGKVRFVLLQTFLLVRCRGIGEQHEIKG